MIAMLAVSISAAISESGGPQTSGQRYKSVRVLNDMPASQMIEMMSVIAGSLGVTCAHCHETDFESDAKPTKEKARRMILLTRTVDQSFGGRGTITCNTCHQGKPVPPSIASVEQAGWMQPKAVPQKDVPLPTAEQVLNKYVRAVGSAQALAAVTKRTVTGKVTRDNGRTGPMSGTFTLHQELPGTVRLDTDFSFPPEARSEISAEFFRPRRAEELAARARVIGRDNIRSRPTLIVEITNPTDGSTYRLHFEEEGGLLVRRESEKATPLGVLAERHDLFDYRDVDGIKQPARIEWMRADYHVIFEIVFP
jgi:hypothetical protein